MNPLQEKLLAMMAWFHDFCEKNNITYYVCGGTLLGAIRHKGFIPWDDDIDVIVPRPDYDKLLSLLSKQEGKYLLESPFTGNGDYFHTYSKLYDTTTTLIERAKKTCKRGVFLDVFPLDGIGNSQKESLKNYKKLSFKNKFLNCRSYSVRRNGRFFRNFAIFLTHLVPNFIVNNKKLSLKIARSYTRCDYESSSWVGNLACGKREIHEKALLGKPVKLPFENILVNGIEHYDAYLTQLYGDWKQLPPEKNRVASHAFLELDLNRSYLENDETPE